MFNFFGENKKKIFVDAMVKGRVQSISECVDEGFKLMGDGFMITPEESTIVSPFDGKIVMTFPTKHALGIVDEKGNEFIVHVGIDTVDLQGEGFILAVESGQYVKSGEILLQADFDKFKDKVTSIDVLFINTQGYKCNILKSVVETGEKKVASFDLK